MHVFNLQGSEIIVILLLALVVLGPEKLPDAIRKFTQTYSELKKMGTGFQSELKSALDEPMREMRETADMVMNAANPDKLAAQAEAGAEVERRRRSRTRRRALEPTQRARGANAIDSVDGAPVNLIAAANSSAASSRTTFESRSDRRGHRRRSRSQPSR